MNYEWEDIFQVVHVLDIPAQLFYITVDRTPPIGPKFTIESVTLHYPPVLLREEIEDEIMAKFSHFSAINDIDVARQTLRGRANTELYGYRFYKSESFSGIDDGPIQVYEYNGKYGISTHPYYELFGVNKK